MRFQPVPLNEDLNVLVAPFIVISRMMPATAVCQVHHIGWVLIGLSGVFMLGVAGLIIQSVLSNRRPDPRNPKQMLRHHTNLLMLYAESDPGFKEQARRFAELFRDLVPPTGCSTSLQGEVVRSIDRLGSEERRNGNLNWGLGYDEFITVLRESLLDGTVFDETALDEIAACIDTVSRHGTQPQEEDQVYRAFACLIKAAVQFCEAHPEPIPYTPKSPRST